MKRIFVSVVVMLFMAMAMASPSVVRTPLIDYLPTERDYVFELKTTKFDKVLLDCSSFITGLVFYNEKKEAFNFYLDGSECEDVHLFFLDSQSSNKPVCFEIETESKHLTISRKNLEQCI